MLKKATDNDAVRILAEWARGRTYPEIAADFGMTEDSVKNVIRRSYGSDAEKAKSDHVIRMTARKSELHAGKRKHPELDASVSTKWLAGEAASAIARDLGVTRNVVIGVVNRSRIQRETKIAVVVRKETQAKGSATKLAKSERQRDLSAQAMIERRTAGTLLRKPPQLALISSVELPPKCPEPPEDLYAHLRTDDSLRRVLSAMSVSRDIGTGIT